MKTKLKYSLMLVLTAVIWGAAFVAQKEGMEYLPALSFNGIRSFLGAFALAPVAAFFDKKDGVLTKWTDKTLIKGGLICGLLLFFATGTQQIGITTTAAGKSGFITALYIVMVPIFSLALRKKPGKFIWVSVILATVGLYFLCINGSFSLKSGDIWLFACAMLFAGQILAVDKFAPNVDVIKLSCYQFLVTGLISIIPMIIERPSMNAIVDCWFPIAYAGLFSSGIAYTLQMEAQKKVKPTVASLIMSLESVFSVLFGALILHERLSSRELVGCIIMFAAVILAQLAPAKEDEVIERKTSNE